MKKILQVNGSLVKGGTENFILSNYDKIKKCNVEYDFYITSNKVSLTINNSKELNIFYGSSIGIFNFLKSSISFLKFLKNNKKYDAIHCHSCLGNFGFVFIAWLMKIPIRISHFHDQFGLSKKQLLLDKLKLFFIYIFSTKILFCSEKSKVAYFGKKISNKFLIINNGIEIEKYFCNNKRNDLILGNITRYDKNKNQKFIIDVFSEVLKKEPNAKLILGGPDSGEKQNLIDYAKSLEIYSNIDFLDEINNVEYYLKKITDYIFPSLHEGFGFAALEAQVANCDCYINKDGIPKEIDMGFNKIHFLSLNDSPLVWSNKIIENHNNFQIIDKEIIYKYVTDKGYNLDNTSLKLLELYNEN